EVATNIEVRSSSGFSINPYLPHVFKALTNAANAKLKVLIMGDSTGNYPMAALGYGLQRYYRFGIEPSVIWAGWQFPADSSGFADLPTGCIQFVGNALVGADTNFYGGNFFHTNGVTQTFGNRGATADLTKADQLQFWY